MSDPKAQDIGSRNTKWVEGLRGVAAMLVVTSHLALSYCDKLDTPRFANQEAHWFNMPFIRVMFEGSPWVSVFLILTGFVNALKPLKQTRSGDTDAALASLASSCFRRSLRLILPCSVATCICWVMAELGAFKTGNMVMSGWMIGTSPQPSGSIFKAIVRLIRALFETWAWGSNDLEGNQWAMLLFLKGSIAVYVFLLATVKTQAKYRMWIATGLIAYGWFTLDAYTFMPIFTGVLLAEGSMTDFATNLATQRRSTRCLPHLVLFAGWYCISFPSRKQDRMPWSQSMLDLGQAISPSGANVHKFYSHIGASLIITAITFSNDLQRVFNLRPLQWLGARSFPIYLIHGPILRSFMNWIVFAGSTPVIVEQKDELGRTIREYLMYSTPGLSRFMWAIPVFVALTVVLADQWLKHVEPRCGSVAKWIEVKTCVRSQPKDVEYIEQSSLAEQGQGSLHSPFSRATTPMNEVELTTLR